MKSPISILFFLIGLSAIIECRDSIFKKPSRSRTLRTYVDIRLSALLSKFKPLICKTDDTTEIKQDVKKAMLTEIDLINAYPNPSNIYIGSRRNYLDSLDNLGISPERNIRYRRSQTSKKRASKKSGTEKNKRKTVKKDDKSMKRFQKQLRKVWEKLKSTNGEKVIRDWAKRSALQDINKMLRDTNLKVVKRQNRKLVKRFKSLKKRGKHFLENLKNKNETVVRSNGKLNGFRKKMRSKKVKRKVSKHMPDCDISCHTKPKVCNSKNGSQVMIPDSCDYVLAYNCCPQVMKGGRYYYEREDDIESDY